eukprot:GHVN01012195.1.p1 GENE.GHVN01012195.1~~GHVN01012195.1.p1  ORF type:complete len:536 (+),score=47.08 GHVN01012195.1:145-1752(+)
MDPAKIEQIGADHPDFAKAVGELKKQDSDHDGEPPKPDPKGPVPMSAYILGATCALSGLVFGYDIGGSGGTFVMTYFTDHVGWTKSINSDGELEWDNFVRKEMGWIGSFFPIGCLFGALCSGWTADMIGRWWVLMGANVFFILGAILQCITVNIDMLYAGRFISGFGIGILSCMTGVYVGETAPFQIRGLLVTMFQLFLTFGIVLAGLLNLALKYWEHGWRISYGGNILFSILMMIGMLFLPESPRYHAMKGRPEKCREVLTRYRVTETEVDWEMWSIKQELDEAGAGAGGWGEVFSSKNRQGYRTMLGMSIQFFQQWCGINAIMMFAPTIIETFWTSDAALYGNLTIQFVNFVATFIAVYLVDRVGRIPLMMTGGIGMSVSLLMVSLLSMPFSDYTNNVGTGISIIMFITIFVLFFSYSWGPLGWVICSELHSNRVRGKAVSLSTATNWFCAAIVSKVTPLLIDPDVFDLWGTFLMFFCFACVMTAWVWFMLPETAGVKLEELDDLFNEFKIGQIKRTKWTPPSQRDLKDEVVG